MAASTSVQNSHVLADPLLKSFERSLRAENKREQTIAHYVGAARQFLTFCRNENLPPLESITREHVELWMERLRTTYKPYSIRNRWIGLRLFFKWLRSEDEIPGEPSNEYGPMQRMKMPAVDEVEKDVVSPEDVARTLRMLEKSKRWRDAALLAVVYDTGMRASEIAEARMEHVNLDTGIIFIPKTKNHRTRAVKLSPQAVKYVDRYRRHLKGEPEYFIGGQRGPITRSGVYWAIRGAFEDAGVQGMIGVHDMRHTSATHAATEMSERDMMTLYGWNDSSMARHYASKALEQAALAAHSKASPMSRLPEIKGGR
jgi:integrase